MSLAVRTERFIAGFRDGAHVATMTSRDADYVAGYERGSQAATSVVGDFLRDLGEYEPWEDPEFRPSWKAA